MKDRQKGCMYGLAIGDALGAAVEFCDPGTFPPVTGYRGGGPHGIEAGEWTDDTSMALALADSIAHGWDLRDQARRYVEWHQEGKYAVNGWCFDIGGTTLEALDGFRTTGELSAPDWEGASGNGSIMRLAPVAIKYHDHVLLDDYSKQSSTTTHASRRCVSACKFLGTFLSKLFVENDKVKAIQDVWQRWNFESYVDDIVYLYTKPDICDKIRNRTDVRGTGYVIDSLDAALWAFMTSDSFEETVLKAVNLGEDADTTGAVAGQMAGAFWGFDAIPSHLVEGLARKDMIDLYLDPLM